MIKAAISSVYSNKVVSGDRSESHDRYGTPAVEPTTIRFGARNIRYMTVEEIEEDRRLREDEDIEWHIGGHDSLATMKAAEEIDEALASA